jgi:hypothetical protein
MDMNAIFIISLAIVLGCSGLSAQASFQCANNQSTEGVNAPVYDWAGNLLSGADWRVELYGGATQDSLSPAVAFGFGTPVVVSLYRPGYFQGPGLVVPSVPARGWAWLQVKVWDVELGVTYEQALARGQGGYGQSALFYLQGTNPGGELPDLPAPLVGLQSFSVSQPIPEPSSCGLLALGLGGLVWCRRR